MPGLPLASPEFIDRAVALRGGCKNSRQKQPAGAAAPESRATRNQPTSSGGTSSFRRPPTRMPRTPRSSPFRVPPAPGPGAKSLWLSLQAIEGGEDSNACNEGGEQAGQARLARLEASPLSPQSAELGPCPEAEASTRGRAKARALGAPTRAHGGADVKPQRRAARDARALPAGDKGHTLPLGLWGRERVEQWAGREGAAAGAGPVPWAWALGYRHLAGLRSWLGGEGERGLSAAGR